MATSKASSGTRARVRKNRAASTPAVTPQNHKGNAAPAARKRPRRDDAAGGAPVTADAMRPYAQGDPTCLAGFYTLQNMRVQEAHLDDVTDNFLRSVVMSLCGSCPESVVNVASVQESYRPSWRMIFKIAADMAKATETRYRFRRGDDVVVDTSNGCIYDAGTVAVAVATMGLTLVELRPYKPALPWLGLAAYELREGKRLSGVVMLLGPVVEVRRSVLV